MSKALIAAEAKIAALETYNAEAETHNTEAEQHIVALMGRIAALEARITVAKNVYMSQKARIAELESALNTRGVKTAPAAPSAEPAPVVTHYTDHCGRVWEKTRVGNRATSHQVQSAAH